MLERQTGLEPATLSLGSSCSTTALGGSVLLTGSVAGMLLMRMEGISFGWYLRHIAPKVLTGTIVGYIVLLAQSFVLG